MVDTETTPVPEMRKSPLIWIGRCIKLIWSNNEELRMSSKEQGHQGRSQIVSGVAIK